MLVSKVGGGTGRGAGRDVLESMVLRNGGILRMIAMIGRFS